VEISTVEDFGLSKPPYPPPERGCAGLAAALVVSALVALLTTLGILVYLIA
jgi:hypothetical protein